MPTDARGHSVSIGAPPRRIVSLVPSQTELLAHLGLDDEVAGITRFCERPKGWRSTKTIVGGTKQVDVETVRDLDPDLILANHEENTALTSVTKTGAISSSAATSSAVFSS